jgi:hypothetical protein
MSGPNKPADIRFCRAKRMESSQILAAAGRNAGTGRQGIGTDSDVSARRRCFPARPIAAAADVIEPGLCFRYLRLLRPPGQGKTPSSSRSL